jgi:hypothetical protein
MMSMTTLAERARTVWASLAQVPVAFAPVVSRLPEWLR